MRRSTAEISTRQNGLFGRPRYQDSLDALVGAGARREGGDALPFVFSKPSLNRPLGERDWPTAPIRAGVPDDVADGRTAVTREWRVRQCSSKDQEKPVGLRGLAIGVLQKWPFNGCKAVLQTVLKVNGKLDLLSG